MAKKEFEELVLEKLDILTVDVSGLKEDVSGLKDDVSSLKHKVDILDNRTLVMDKKIDGLYEKNDDLQDSIHLNSRYINQAFQKISEQNIA